jgi:hypothetical protein
LLVDQNAENEEVFELENFREQMRDEIRDGVEGREERCRALILLRSQPLPSAFADNKKLDSARRICNRGERQ